MLYSKQIKSKGTVIDMTAFSVKLEKVVDQFGLVVVSEPERVDDILITTSDVNRPGLQLTGFLEHFGSDRMQVMGRAEMAYLRSLGGDERHRRLDRLFSHKFPCMVVARRMDIFPEMMAASHKYHVPILMTNDITSAFLSGIIRYLNVHLAPRENRHGVLVEVYGEGILIQGESGVGKSETALEIVKRGHRLIADDLVEIRRVSDTTLLGSAPEIIRHFIEIRGIGLLDVANLYGVGSVKMQENVSLVINLEIWDRAKTYERVGINDEYTDILGIKVPSHTIPVRPGRNLAIIVEVAAMNYRQKAMGYNAARTLVDRAFEDVDGGGRDDGDDRRAGERRGGQVGDRGALSGGREEFLDIGGEEYAWRRVSTDRRDGERRGSERRTGDERRRGSAADGPPQNMGERRDGGGDRRSGAERRAGSDRRAARDYGGGMNGDGHYDD